MSAFLTDSTDIGCVIVTFLPARELLMCEMSCKHLLAVSRFEPLWRALCDQHPAFATNAMWCAVPRELLEASAAEGVQRESDGGEAALDEENWPPSSDLKPAAAEKGGLASAPFASAPSSWMGGAAAQPLQTREAPRAW